MIEYGSRLSRPGQVTPELINEIKDAVLRTQGRMQGGLVGLSTPYGTVPTLSQAVLNPKMVVDSFLATIVDKGPPPDNKPDFSDCRYWVRELIEATAENSELAGRPTFKKLDDFIKVEEPAHEAHRGRWVPAANLGELSLDGAGSDTHDLDTDGTKIVQCLMTMTPDGKARFYFSSGGGGGGGSAYVVVREVFAAPSKTIKVQKVAYDFGDEEDGENAEITIKTVGDPFNVMAKPGLLSKDYQLWQWQTEIHQTRTRYLRADRVGGTWILSREHDVMTDRLPSGVRWTDCKPAATTR